MIPSLQERMLKEFVDVLDENAPLTPMDRPAMNIELKPNAIPYAVNGCKPSQVARYIPGISQGYPPIRGISQGYTISDMQDIINGISIGYHWGTITSPPVLSTYNPTAERVLQSDASCKNGLGFEVQQRHSIQWWLIQCGSWFVSNTENRLTGAQGRTMGIQEMQAVSNWPANFYSCRGPPATGIILDKYTIDAVENPKLQRLKENMSPYMFKTIWRKGSDHSIPDALSRAPVAPRHRMISYTRKSLQVQSGIFGAENNSGSFSTANWLRTEWWGVLNSRQPNLRTSLRNG